MKVNADGTRARIDVRGDMSAREVEDLIVKLAMLRSSMQPPVPEKFPDATSDPDQSVLMESEAAMTAALRRNGGIRLWLRNRGIGWLGFEVEPSRARAIANYILSRTEEGAVNLFTPGDGKTH